jgi:probable phosphomutase (TIGR03848 family)
MTSSASYILLIRHGENDWVGTNRLAGRTPSVHLNEKGRQQANTLAELLRKQPIAALYSSPLVRCMETAQPLAQRLDLPVIEETGILEVDYGTWRGGELKELSNTPDWQKVQHYPSLFRFPGGETLREVQARAVGAIERLAERHANQVIALFSHGDVIRTTLAHFLGVPLDLFQRVIINTASISVIGISDGRPMVMSMNYLAELPQLKIQSPSAAEDS